MFSASLKTVTLPFCDSPAFAPILLVPQITYEMKNLVLLPLAVAPKIHPCASSLVWHSH